MAAFVCRECLASPLRLAVTPSLCRAFGARAVSRANAPNPSPSHSRRIPTGLRNSPTRRLFQHLAQQPQKTDSATLAQPPATPQAQKPAKQDLGGDAVHISQKEQRKRDWNIVKKLAENLWPKDDWKTRGRVVLGFGLLISGKVRRCVCLEQRRNN